MGRYRPTFFLGLSLAHLSGLAQPTYLILYNIYYIIILYIFLKTKTNFKNHLKKIVIFSNIFLSILHNIGLYIYTLKYKFGIKIPIFLWNISKKIQNILKIISKTFKLISLFKNKKIYILFSCIRPNPKNFQCIFSLKNYFFLMFWKSKKMDIITSLWSFIRVWPKYQKPFSNFF